MTTPAILTKTASTFAILRESCPKSAPKKRVKSPEVEDSTVVLATLVRASAALEKYYKKPKNICQHFVSFPIRIEIHTIK